MRGRGAHPKLSVGLHFERRSGQQRWMQQRAAGLSVAAAVVLFVVYALVLGRGAAWLDGNTLRGLTASQRASEIDTMRGYLIQIGAGVLAAGALLYTALNFQLAREGHVTDRYTKAIEQLGSDRLDVRLGAIYALERIMIDSARDHPTIVEVLAAFVREHSQAAESDAGNDASGLPNQHPRRLAIDTQAAITVLGRRPAGRAERGPVYLARANLAILDLSRANLSGADLIRVNLAEANLARTNLARAKLFRANLAGALVAGADLADADLTGANLTGANLHGARLIGADLSDANLTDADLTGADLTGADLTGAVLARVALSVEQRSVLRVSPAISS